MEIEGRLYDVYKKMLTARDVGDWWFCSPGYREETSQKERELYKRVKAVFIELEGIVMEARKVYDDADNLPSPQRDALEQLIEKFYRRLSTYHDLTEESEEWGPEWDKPVQHEGWFTCIFTQEPEAEFSDGIYE